MDHIPTDIAYESTLRDGTPVLIRPVLPDDKRHFSEGFKQLSEASRYQRFMRTMHELSVEDLRFFTEIDYTNHVAWGALVGPPDGERGVGVARYVRRADNSRTAEAAVTIIDEYQHRGIGTLLIGALYWSALTAGIESFEGYILGENEQMKRLLRVLGAEMESEGHGVVHAKVSVVQDHRSLPDTKVGSALKQVVDALTKAAARH